MANEGPCCVVCAAPKATPNRGHRLPFCDECHNTWEASPEYQVMVTARQDFVTRRRQELRK